MQKKTIKKQLIPFSAVVWIAIFGFTPHVEASTNSLCKTLFKRKAFERAAQCFQELAFPMEKKTLGKKNTLLRFQHLRNAVLSWRKAAQVEKSPLRSTYLQEKALRLAQRILKKKYYQNKAQKQLMSLVKERLEGKIGYVKVTIFSGIPEGKLQLSGGYRFAERQYQGLKWQLRLRSGNYTVVATHSNAAPQSRSFSIRPNQAPLLIKFAAPVKKRQKPISRPSVPPPQAGSKAPWILVGVGGAVLVAGGALIGVAYAVNHSSVESTNTLQQRMEQNESSVTAAATREALGGHATANTLYVTGWIAGGVGVATVMAGVILYVMRPKPSPPPTNQTPSTRSNILFAISD